MANRIGDPLSSLNFDIMHTIFTYLPLVDIIRCEGVSRTWKRFVEEWVEVFAPRFKLQPAWSSASTSAGWNVLSYREIKDIGRAISKYKVPTGFLDPFHESLLTTSGSYIVWKRDRETPLETIPDSVFWTTIPQDGHQQRCDSTEIPATTFLDDALAVTKMRVNTSGIILLDIQCMTASSSRAIAYSLVGQEKLWECNNTWTEEGTDYVHPLEIGQSLVYYLAHRGPGVYDIAAFNFRTGRKAYQCACLSIPYNENHRFSGKTYAGVCHGRCGLGCWLNFDDSRLLSTRNGEEFLVIQRALSSDNMDESRLLSFQILRGVDGHTVYTVSVANHLPATFTVDPVTNELAVVWEITDRDWTGHLSPQTRNFYIQRYGTLVWPFTYEPGGSFRPQDLVILWYKSKYWGTSPIVRPSTMTAIQHYETECERQGIYGTIGVFCHSSFDPTEDPQLFREAEFKVKYMLPRLILKIGHSFLDTRKYSAATVPAATPGWRRAIEATSNRPLFSDHTGEDDGRIFFFDSDCTLAVLCFK
ncbi:F-box protein [Aspergillus lucknowensis]|uniref:F-box domain-containing protein n=1 Tax=Aspergillus lucknowensis TaxID=176173 RepID=A0ABR4LIL7_9EURO